MRRREVGVRERGLGGDEREEREERGGERDARDAEREVGSGAMRRARGEG